MGGFSFQLSKNLMAFGERPLIPGMEFRNRKEPERALLVHRSLDLDGNVFWTLSWLCWTISPI
jgi:hypothetical protein